MTPRYEDVVLVRGGGTWAGRAAQWRTRGEYSTAAILEEFHGERRTWGDRGETLHWRWSPRKDEFARNNEWGFEYEGWEPATPPSVDFTEIS